MGQIFEGSDTKDETNVASNVEVFLPTPKGTKDERMLPADFILKYFDLADRFEELTLTTASTTLDKTNKSNILVDLNAADRTVRLKDRAHFKIRVQDPGSAGLNELEVLNDSDGLNVLPGTDKMGEGEVREFHKKSDGTYVEMGN